MLKLLSYEYGSLLAVVFLSTFVYGASNFTTLTIRMPNARHRKSDAYICTSKRIPSKDQYIVGFEPKADKSVAHHMLLFGCDRPGSSRETWDCSNGLECANSESIIFAWANGATTKTLPKDVGFQIGKKAGIRYLVLQVHYKRKDVKSDDSGFVLHVSPQRQPYLAGIYLMWSGEADIPPESEGVHNDIICPYRDETPMYAFAFRTHAHGLGRVITGYKVNHNNWTLLGKGDPKEPQAFYPMDGIHKISKGDTLAARCTYDSKGHHLHSHVQIGPTGDDEMCNFYIMYYREANKPDVSDAACSDELSSSSKFVFPADSDTPIRQTTQKLSTDSTTQKLSTDSDLESDKHSMKTDREMLGGDKEEMPTKSHNFENSQLFESFPTPSPKTKKYLVEDKPSESEYRIVKDWPKLGKEKLGQVSGVALDSKGNVLVFHRGSRIWSQKSFDSENNFNEDFPIKEHTVLTLHPVTGEILGRWGRNMFYLPHGLTVDHHDNIWLTDVGTHQVYKYPAFGGSKAMLTVGEQFVPGSDSRHFCKPTDVAVERSGSFFVADGYCNNRIMKFSAKGKFLGKWGSYGTVGNGELNLPHSLSLDESKHLLYIADRQNGRVVVLHTTRGVFLPVIKRANSRPVFAVDFNPYTGHLHVLNGILAGMEADPVKGFTIANNHVIETWPDENPFFDNPHDVISSANDVDLYVTEIGPNKVWKISKPKVSLPSHFPAICSLAKEVGPCRAAMPRWYFNITKQTCEHFIYGGCSGNDNNFGSKRECEAKCSRSGEGFQTRKHDTVIKESKAASKRNHTTTPTEKVTDDWQNAAGEDEGTESNIYYATHYNNSSNHTVPKDVNKDESRDDEEVLGGMIPALVILSVLAVPIVFLLLISIALRVRAYRRDTRYKSNRLLKTDQDGLAVGRTRGWMSYMNCCNRQNYGFDKVNLAEFYSDSDSEGV